MRVKFRDGYVDNLILPAAILVPIELLDSFAIHPRLAGCPDRASVVEINCGLEPVELQLLESDLDYCAQGLWGKAPAPELREDHVADIGHFVTMAPDR